MASESPAPAPLKRRLKKRVVIPLILIALVVVATLWAYVRGTWADSAPRDPSSPSEGVIVQLLRTPEGHVPVRCAVVVDAPLAEVWKVVTDYDHYGEIFPSLAGQPQVKREEGGVVVLTGTAHSWLGDWPFQVRIAHEETAERRSATWAYTGQGDVRVNRGGFTLTPRGDKQTLLVYALEVELALYPTFLVNNVLLSRQPGVMRALVARVGQR